MNNTVLVSGIEQSDLFTHVHVSILFQILFPFRILQTTEQRYLCYTVGPSWLSILNVHTAIAKVMDVLKEGDTLYTFYMFFSNWFCLNLLAKPGGIWHIKKVW